MSIVFTKTYSGKIKRAISEGQICPSTLPELYINKEQTTEIDSHNSEDLYPSKVFNIVSKKQSVEITTNTLNILVSDVVIDGVIYYFYLDSIPTNLNVLAEYDYEIVNDKVYLNTDEKYLQDNENIYTVYKVYSLDIYNLSSNVSIRKLKDRFKITIKTNNPSLINIDVKSNSIFSPTIYNNWLIFHDCIYKIDNSTSSLFTHSFELYDKVEIHQKNVNVLLRDIPVNEVSIEHINDKYNKIIYKTFRSNLMINTELGQESFVYATKSQYSELEVCNYPKTDLNIFPIFSIIKDKTRIKELNLNPYLNTNVYEGAGEKIYFIIEDITDSTFITKKYNRSKDVPLGTERVLLSMYALINRRSIQTNSISGPTSINDVLDDYRDDFYNTTTYTGSNSTKLSELLTYLQSNLE